ncbi:hypothetical protein TNCV_232151 [Trichonephila clavipes]|nr:hypothetical protein TNCV_232151 [Trichonephila clavipes]
MKSLLTDRDDSTSECVIFGDVLRPNACTLFPADPYMLFIGDQNMDSSAKKALAHSSTVQFTCWRHHFNRTSLDWTDKGAQIRGTLAYRPFKCSLG